MLFQNYQLGLFNKGENHFFGETMNTFLRFFAFSVQENYSRNVDFYAHKFAKTWLYGCYWSKAWPKVILQATQSNGFLQQTARLAIWKYAVEKSQTMQPVWTSMTKSNPSTNCLATPSNGFLATNCTLLHFQNRLIWKGTVEKTCTNVRSGFLATNCTLLQFQNRNYS